MNVSMPTEAVVPTLDGPVLVALSRLNSAVTGRQVHQLTGVGSEAGVRNVLTRLVRQGVVRANPAGSAVLYSINRAHIAWPAIELLAGLRTELFDKLRAALSQWDRPARCAAVFGSFARGDGDADSDIDLLLVRARRTNADDDAWQAQISQIREDVLAWTGNTCQIYEQGIDDLERRSGVRDALAAEWRNDAITVYGTDLRRLLRDLGYRVGV